MEKDSVADGAVWIERVSDVKFPVKQGKNREFLRFRAWTVWLGDEKPWLRLGFLGIFPTQRNREFFSGNRESFLRIRESMGWIRESTIYPPSCRLSPYIPYLSEIAGC